ncbi:MAG: hypothetical protein HKN47_27050 [Pirellulaceae bacterium]|nr:hypothetical protein [Pirellulaceae bacterium]
MVESIMVAIACCAVITDVAVITTSPCDTNRAIDTISPLSAISLSWSHANKENHVIGNFRDARCLAALSLNV